MKTPDHLPLFQLYPNLAKALPYVSLGQFPTPVGKLEQVGCEIGVEQLYIKRDDLSGIVYGGNKVRKLEFLLGDALRRKSREVITMGYAGSNHALATAIYARQLCLKCTSVLLPQVNAQYVRRNLLASLHAGAELVPCANFASLICRLNLANLRSLMRARRFPKFIPAGGSNALGIVGYVNAALELREQIQAGLIPEPDFIYVALGSTGTCVGLTLGLKVGGLKAQVIAVRVIEKMHANEKRMLSLIRKSNRLLCRYDSSFPQYSFTRKDFCIRHDCMGEGYAHFTQKGVAAACLMQEKAGIPMNGAYSAKAFSALMDDAQAGTLRGKVALFWNTYNSRDITTGAAQADYRDLPKAFHRYFEEAPQELDV